MNNDQRHDASEALKFAEELINLANYRSFIGAREAEANTFRKAARHIREQAHAAVDYRDVQLTSEDRSPDVCKRNEILAFADSLELAPEGAEVNVRKCVKYLRSAVAVADLALAELKRTLNRAREQAVERNVKLVNAHIEMTEAKEGLRRLRRELRQLLDS